MAIEIDEDVADALGRLQAMLPCGRAVPRSNLHLTLTFLDDQPEERLEDLHFELEKISSAPFELKISGLGSFGGAQPRAVFADVVPHRMLTKLQDGVVSAARRVGIRTERRRYHPHITIARLGRNEHGGDRLQTYLARNSDVTLPDLPVRGFSLWSSSLHPEGARYDILARYIL